MISYLLAAPATEPVDLATAKAWLRLDGSDEDSLVTSLITAARLQVESTTGRGLLTQSWRVCLDDWPPDGMVRLPVSPLQSLTAITVYDAAGNAVSLPLGGVLWDANAAPTVLFLPAAYGAAALLRPRQGIEIDYVAGYGADPASVPQALVQAMLTLVAYWFENRDAVLLAGTGSLVPAGLDLVLQPYRSVRL